MLTTIERVLFLRSVNLFFQIPGDVLARVAQVTKIVRFASGQQLIRQGDVGDCLFVVIDGEVDVLVDEQRVTQRRAGDVLGELAVLDKQPRRAACVAVTEVTALKIDRDDFAIVLAENPELAQGIIAVLIQTLDEAV